MAKGLYYYKLQSPYPEDVTKNCKLTINEIDSNFLSLKDEDIKSADFDRESKTLVLTRNNGEKLIVVLDDAAYDLNIDANCSDEGVTLSVYYDGKNGVKQFKVDHLITLEMLRSKIEELIGTDILTKVITDGTLKGYGTLDSPLGLNGTEKTGMYAPVIARIDLTQGGKLPEVSKLGTRYATIEYVNDYGYLYNGSGLDKISKNISDEGHGWRVPSKEDWDTLLNLIEPCEYRNHNSARCHVELGKTAGKYLKSVCGWVGSPNCDCTPTVPITSCTFSLETGDEDYISYDDNSQNNSDVPDEKKRKCIGVDKYGMSILPSGVVTLDAYDRPQASAFGEKSVVWTTSHVYGDAEQDRYVKIFDWNKCGVTQEAECSSPFYSVRLVKDYNGSNYFDTEYIDGIPYKTILFPEIRQIWLASNYAKKEGFIPADGDQDGAEVAEVNNGEIIEKRKAVFLNEWNGCYWEKKQLNEGDTVVVENTCFDVNNGEKATNVCWVDTEDVEHCVEVVIPDVAQYNIEYRVFTTGGTSTQDECNQDLVNTDYLAIERLLRVIIPIIEQEREERVSADTEIWKEIDNINNRIDEEISARTEGDLELWEALSEEAEARVSGDTMLNEKIDKFSAYTEWQISELWSGLTQEISDRIDEDSKLRVALSAETEERKAEDESIREALSAETAARIEGDEFLQDQIDAEVERATSEEQRIELKLDEEIERAKTREDEIDGQLLDPSKNPYTMSAAVGKDDSNLILKSKDGDEAHFIKIMFDGNFGEI